MSTENAFFRWWRIVYPILLVWFLSIAITSALVWYCQTVLVSGAETEMDTFQVEEYWREQYQSRLLGATAVTHVLTLAAAAFFYGRDRKQNSAYEAEKRPGFLWYVLLIPFGISCSFVVNGLMNLSGLVQVLWEDYEAMSNTLYETSSPWLSIFTVAIAAPIAEELVFRGLCYRRLREYNRAKHAIIMSAILFGAYHGNMLQAIYAFLLGVVFAWCYERFRSIAAPILLHMAANVFSWLISEIPEINAALGGTIWRLVFSILIFTLVGSFCYYLFRVRICQEENEV